MTALTRSALLLPLALCAGSALAQESELYFTPLGPDTTARDLSADGRFVVGTQGTGISERPYRWSASEGRIGLSMPQGYGWGTGVAISSDGSVVAGQAYPSSGAGFLWTSSGAESFTDSGSQFSVKGLSGDGLTVVATQSHSNQLDGTYLGDSAMRWTRAGWTSLASPSNTLLYTNGVSTDGNVVVGGRTTGRLGTIGPFTGLIAVRWNALGGIIPLPTPDATSIANDVSADGTVIVGKSGSEAVYWQNDVLIRLGDLPGGIVSSNATAVSADGRIVAGVGTGAEGARAFLWDAVNGMRPADDVLRLSGLGSALDGWAITSVTAVAVSPSGSTVFTGLATKDGVSQAFVAAVPEPATLAAFGLGALALLRRRKA